MDRNIYVIGDIHGDFDMLQARFYDLLFTNTSKEKKDVLFVAGDAGFINSYENESSKQKRIDILNKLPFIIIVVLGNHENYDVIESFNTVKIFNGTCYKEDNVDVYYSLNGQIFDIDGIKIFTFNGGLSIDKMQRLQLQEKYGRKFYWEQEIKEQDFDAAFDNYFKHQVDYIITHDIPLSIYNKLPSFILNKKESICPLQYFFQKIYSINKFKHWYAAHYHPTCPVTIDKVTILPIGYIQKIPLNNI